MRAKVTALHFIKSNLKELYCYILFVLASNLSLGQELEYVQLSYGSENGIPTSEVYSVMEDRKGYLWFTHEFGVTRFDGYDFKKFSMKDGLSGYTVFRSYEDDFNRIWFSLFNGGLCYYKNDSIYEYPFNAILDSVIPDRKWITHLEVDSLENLHFFSFNSVYGVISPDGTYQRKTAKKETNDRLKITFDPVDYAKVERFPGEFKNCLTIESNCWKDTVIHVEHEGCSLEFSDPEPNSIYFKYGGKHVLATKNDVIVMDSLLAVTGFSVTETGENWLCRYGGGIEIYKNSQILREREPPKHKIMADLNVSRMLFRENGEVWLAVQNKGVNLIVNRNIRNYKVHGTYREGNIISVFKNYKNQMIYATAKGKILGIDKDENHKLIHELEGDFNRVCQDSSGRFYVSSFNRLPDPAAQENIKILQGRSFVIVNRNKIYTVLGNLFLIYEDDHKIYDSGEQGIKDHFYCIYKDRYENCWAGGHAGFYHYGNNGLEKVDLGMKQKTPPICDIAELSDGTLVLCGIGGELIFFRKGESGYKRVKIVLKEYILKNIHIDNDNTIWISTDKGLVRFDVYPDAAFKMVNISTRHGLASNEIRDIASDSSCIYVATDQGLSVFNKHDLQPNTKPPKTQINGIKVNGEWLADKASTNFKYNQNYIEFSYTGICFRMRGDVNYQYKLEGVDQKWQHTTSRTVRYPTLLPGDYQFMVKASNEDGYWSVPAVFNFSVSKPFWNQWWFLLICIVGTLLSGRATYRIIRKNKMTRREKNEQIERQKWKIIETELKALRSQMNPHFTFNTLNSLQNSIKKFDQEKALKYTRDFSLLMRKILENSQSLFISVREEIEMLNLYIELENMRFNNEIEYILFIDKNIDQDFHEIPSMIIQPIVENAINHGLNPKVNGAKKLSIHMVEKPEGILCVVQDNGIGRVKSEMLNQQKKLNKKSMGTTITTERLELFYAEVGKKINFKIIDLYDNSGKAKGTRAEFFFNYE